MSIEWPFDESPDTAALTTSFVLDGDPILRVYRDYDGDWQFHGSPDDPSTAEVARVVSLQCMVETDHTIIPLHDLPPGWRAFRRSPESQWQREKDNLFPTFSEDGFYLEDADWMSHYQDDVNPPPREIRDDLPEGTFVKLLFRFAAETADREDNQVERMWVQVQAVDEDEFYQGTLENDPHHVGAIEYGDTIHFHPRHIMDILNEDDQHDTE